MSLYYSPEGFLLIAVFAFLFRVVAFWIGSKLLSIKKNSLGDAFAAAFLVSLVETLFGFYGTIAALISIIVQLALIKMVYNESWRETILIALVAVVLTTFFLAYIN